MSKTPTQTPNQKNVLTFPPGAAAAYAKAQLRDDTFTSAGMPTGYTANENGIYELRETKEGDTALPGAALIRRP
jgi:hypothetical protein